MSLASLEDALLGVTTTALAACSRPVPDPAQVYKYHGDPAVWCCDDNGVLYVFWQRAFPERAGIPQGMGKPPGRPKVDIYLRLFRCWPTMGDRGEAPPGLDAAAAGLAADTDCMWQALTGAICDGSLVDHLSGCDELQLVDVTPRSPKGGCAGVQAHLIAGWAPWTT